MKYKIYPMKAGDKVEPIDMSMLVYRYAIGKEGRMLSDGSFAIKGDNGWILVDAGTASSEDIKAMGKELLENYVPYKQLLANLNIDPFEIKHIILTHMHWDHIWNLNLFPNAKIYVQKREVEHAIIPHKHEKRSFGFMGVEGYELPRWLGSMEQFVMLEGEQELFSGIRVVPTPGHTHGSQSVLVDTEDGTYALVGDFIFCMKENWEEGTQIGLFTSCEEWELGYKNLKKYDLKEILPTHVTEVYSQKYYG